MRHALCKACIAKTRNPCSCTCSSGTTIVQVVTACRDRAACACCQNTLHASGLIVGAQDQLQLCCSDRPGAANAISLARTCSPAGQNCEITPQSSACHTAGATHAAFQAEMPLKAVAAPASQLLCSLRQESSSVWRAALLAVAHLQLCQGPLAGPADVLAHGGPQRGVHDGVNGIVDRMHDEGDGCKPR